MTEDLRQKECDAPPPFPCLGSRLLNIGCEKVTEQHRNPILENFTFRVTKHLYQKWEKLAD